MLINPIPLPLPELVPLPEDFLHSSAVHGQAHVARVMIHAFRLIAVTGSHVLSASLWAAVYLHDLARTHDGICDGHGKDAWIRFKQSPAIQQRLSAGGVRTDHWPAIESAVTWHSRQNDAPDSHPHHELISLLKDADALDRVRLGDLDISYIRHPEAVDMADFADRLHQQSIHLPQGPTFFQQLWPIACSLE